MSKEDIFELIVRYSREVIPELESHQFKPGDRLVDLGANSVDRVEITMLTMEALSLKIPPVELAGVKNIGELADVFYGKMQSV
jgi:polyketide biosynthesis acyl carrier protein